MSWEQQGYQQQGYQGQGQGYGYEYGYSGYVEQPQPYPQQPFPQEYVDHGYYGQGTEPEPQEPPVAGAPADAEAEEEKPPSRPPGRDRYFDTLRAVALIRVVTYHTFGWAWAGMVFPSMGIMFGLAGTLMAKSLERPARTVVRSRMRRLLPPFWFWGVFVVLAMLVHDWMPGWQIVYWIVPLGDPPGNAWGEQAWEILWYLRTYLWFVLLSPALLKVFRPAPVPVLLLSLAPIVVFQFLWEPPDNRLGSALTDLATFLFCWILGFAHRDGILERLKAPAVVALSLAAIGFGGWYAFTHQAETGSYDLDDIPLAQAFWSAGYVTLLMWAKSRFGIDFAWLTRFRRTDRVVTIFNSRAVTIYLWHEIALILAVPLIDQFWNVPAFEKWLPLESQWFMFGVGWILIAGFVLLCGWVEDVAGKKKPQLLPGGRPARMAT
ncbi:integral membrane transferase [Streptomyces canus]|uniref:Integral membrane transferase n=1 Tax=Streptomyces canus TaxID=58343 RepID=A0A101SG20_9ACTN|nr:MULTISPECIES: acyltransferase [Streptomyces]KUN73311.1 integral membrane transferase [Streptomyces canus]MDI5903454.1 acyltransferase [Streptomyces sp. 12257]